MATFTVPYTDAGGSPRVSSTVTLQDGTDPSLPVVILLHGTGGTVDDMTNPSIHPGYNYDYNAPIPAIVDRGWHDYPAFGIHSVKLDPTKAVTGLATTLAAEGFGTVTYGQVDSSGLLANPVRELAAVVAEVLTRVPPDRQLALVAHSRGGLLARAYLLTVAGDAAVVGRFLTLVTLHSPHVGTELANIASVLNGELAAVIAGNPALAGPLLGLQALLSAPAYQELAVGSPFLATTVTAETSAGAPVVPTHTFSGTSALLSRSRAWVFTPGSAIPQITSFVPLRIRFRWRTFPVALPPLLTGLAALGLLAPEMEDGVGDVLVARPRSHLPGESSHQTHDLHHFEPLWDPTVHQQVVDVLRAASIP